MIWDAIFICDKLRYLSHFVRLLWKWERAEVVPKLQNACYTTQTLLFIDAVSEWAGWTLAHPMAHPECEAPVNLIPTKRADYCLHTPIWKSTDISAVGNYHSCNFKKAMTPLLSTTKEFSRWQKLMMRAAPTLEIYCILCRLCYAARFWCLFKLKYFK